MHEGCMTSSTGGNTIDEKVYIYIYINIYKFVWLNKLQTTRRRIPTLFQYHLGSQIIG